MAHLTKQGLLNTLWTVLEFGYKAHEKGLSLQACRSEAGPLIQNFVNGIENLPEEIVRVNFRCESGRKKR